LNKIVVPDRWGDEHLYMGYNSSGLRISKSLVWNYRDTCGGNIEKTGDSGDGIEPPPVDLCTYWDTTQTRYLRSFGNTLKEVNGNGYDPTWYIYAGDNRIATIDENGNLYYYLKDHLGSTRMTIHDNGSVYGRYYRYYAFGETESEQVTLNQAYKYTGKPFDTELGLDTYYYGARYYNPHLGRWLAVDPLHDKYPSLSPYVYAADNPITYYDIDGREILFADGFKQNDEMQALFWEAIDYWREFGDFDYIFDKVVKDQRPIYISYVNDPKKTRFAGGDEGKRGMIFWNPFYLMETKEGGFQSASLLLLHELAHAYFFLDDYERSQIRSKNIGGYSFDTFEDKDIITKIESKAAKLSGQGRRSNHSYKAFHPAWGVTAINIVHSPEYKTWEDICRERVSHFEACRN